MGTPARVAMGAGKHAHTNKTRSKAVGGVRHAGDSGSGRGGADVMLVEVKTRSDSGRRGDNSTGGDDGYGGDDGGGKEVEKVEAWWVLLLVVTQLLEVAVWAVMSKLGLGREGVMVEMVRQGAKWMRWMGWWFGHGAIP